VRKRIAIVTERIHPFYRGGAEKTMYDYAKTLSRLYDVTVFTSFDFGAAQKELRNVKFNYVSYKIKKSNKKGNHSLIGIFSFSFSTLLRMRSITNFDVVLLDSIHYLYPKLLLEFLKQRNCKIVTIFYEAWYDYRKSGEVFPFLSLAMGMFVKRLIYYSDAIISISSPTTRSLINNYRVEERNICTIPLGIDYTKIQKYYPPKELADRQYDISYVGRFASIKRVADLVYAIYKISKSGIQIKAALIGDGPEKELMEEEIRTLGLDKNVKILGFLGEFEKYNILSDSKIFALPSEREGFSIATLEAMALGCAPVISKPVYDEVFGASHFVENEVNGLYYNVKDVDALASTIRRLLCNYDELSFISRNAMASAKNYNTFVMERNILKFFAEKLI
jgi:glycosyltransferase involved in cell wall biosynthesis